jgi:hypothetical protein
MSSTAKTWTLRRDTGETKFKGSSLGTSAFLMNHPILAIVALWVIAVIGFVCILQLPIP